MARAQRAGKPVSISLVEEIQGDLEDIFAEAYREAGISVASARPVGVALTHAQERASEYASSRAGDLITDVDEATHDAVSRVISSAVGKGKSDQEVADSLARLFGEDRANLIARTEMATAFNMGVVKALKDAGEEYVFVSDGDEFDEECQNANGEIWTIEEAEANPLEHPNCQREFRPLTEEELADVLEEEAQDEEEGFSAEERERFSARCRHVLDLDRLRAGEKFYSEDQEREPAGSPEGGRFVSKDGGGEGGSHLSPEEALLNYQNRGYARINEELRSGHPSPETLARAEAIDKLFSAEKERDVYLIRGDGAALSAALFEAAGITDLRLDTDSLFSKEGKAAIAELDAKMHGREFQDGAFISTTTDPQLALEKFVPGSTNITRYGGGGLVEILGKAKTLDVDGITGMGANEKEHLLPRGTVFRVEKVTLAPHPDGTRVYLKWRVRIV